MNNAEIIQKIKKLIISINKKESFCKRNKTNKLEARLGDHEVIDEIVVATFTQRQAKSD
jgi:hypothetical protein